MMAGYGVDRGAAVSMRVRITFARGKEQQFDRRKLPESGWNYGVTDWECIGNGRCGHN